MGIFFFCLFTPSYLHHSVSDMTGEAAPHIHQFITPSEASSINKLLVCCVCGKFSLKQHPATWERRFTAKSTTNIKHAGKERTEESKHAVPFVAEAWCSRRGDMFLADANMVSEWLDPTGNMRGEILIIGRARYKYEERGMVVDPWWLVIKTNKPHLFQFYSRAFKPDCILAKPCSLKSNISTG